VTKQSGFTLIEVAIILVLTSIFMVSIIQGLNLYQAQRAINDTLGNTSAIKAGITRFYAERGRYPCPARINVGFNSISSGIEFCPAVGEITPGTCSDAGGNAKGVCYSIGRDADGTGGGDGVLMGVVPYASINLPLAAVKDGWGRKFSYAVTEKLTNSGTFNDAYGVINVVDSSGVGVPTVNPPSSAHLVIISHGPDGAGATAESVWVAPCNAAAIDGENCDVDPTFVVDLRAMANGPQHNDDFVDFQLWSSSNLWSPSPGNPANIYNRNTGNVGVGTQTPTQRLDVSGNLRAVNVMGSQLCDANGTDCFSPTLIGGAGMRCNSVNQAMRGVQNGAPICDNVTFPTSFSASCAPGEFVRGITIAGNVVCSPP
jgi:type II secretory pathway pseudopilin PulG